MRTVLTLLVLDGRTGIGRPKPRGAEVLLDGERDDRRNPWTRPHHRHPGHDVIWAGPGRRLDSRAWRRRLHLWWSWRGRHSGRQRLNTIFGDAGHRGRGGDDILFGGPRTDFLIDGGGDDVMFGGGGIDDELETNAGNDRAFGGEGRDFLSDAGGGNDRLDGGPGYDT